MSGLVAVRCKTCDMPMVQRQTTTPEQAWCGAWWDHPQIFAGTFGHTSSVLFSSPALRTVHAQAGAR